MTSVSTLTGRQNNNEWANNIMKRVENFELVRFHTAIFHLEFIRLQLG